MITLKQLYTESIADDDAVAAKREKRRLVKSMLSIDSSLKAIDIGLSDFNSPGLKAAYADAIKKNWKGNKFDVKAAMKDLEKWYKGR